MIFVGVASEVPVASCEMGGGHALQVGRSDTHSLTVAVISYGPPSRFSESNLLILALSAFWPARIWVRSEDQIRWNEEILNVFRSRLSLVRIIGIINAE